MKHIRTIVVDDEPAARARIGRLLNQDPEIDMVGECRNGTEAVDAVQKLRPDLIYLDVEMPQMNGFEVVTRLGKGRIPFVVFVTAHNQYALKAFDVNAVDYLLKPYDDDRFHSSLAKAKRHIDMRMNTALTGKLMGLMRDHLHAKSDHTEVFTIRERGGELKVPVDEVIYLRAEGNYLHLQLQDKYLLYRNTMNAVESVLDPARFLRIHRSYIVQHAHVRATRYTGNNEFIFTMSTDERILSGRSYKESIAKALEDKKA